MKATSEATATQSTPETPSPGGYWDGGFIGALTTEEVERYLPQATQPGT